MRPTTVWGDSWLNKHRRDKKCPRCEGKRDRPGQRYCKTCHNAYMRKRRGMGIYP